MNEEVKIWYKTIERQKWENTFTRSKSSQISEKHVGLNSYIIQLSPEGEVNTLRGIVVLVFTKSVG